MPECQRMMEKIIESHLSNLFINKPTAQITRALRVNFCNNKTTLVRLYLRLTFGMYHGQQVTAIFESLIQNNRTQKFSSGLLYETKSLFENYFPYLNHSWSFTLHLQTSSRRGSGNGFRQGEGHSRDLYWDQLRGIFIGKIGSQLRRFSEEDNFI